jgi:outer membrane murein-binding lipoprotein Lpp
MIRLTAIIVSVLLLAGCAGQVVDTSCTAFQPITYSASQDSEPTKAQIRGHNAAWQRLCK